MSKLIHEEESRRLLVPMRIKLFEDRLEISFWPFRYSIELDEIEGIEIVDDIPWYVGWGLRITPARLISKESMDGWALCFLAHHGRCILIRRKRGFWRTIVISPRDADRLASILEGLMKRGQRAP